MVGAARGLEAKERGLSPSRRDQRVEIVLSERAHQHGQRLAAREAAGEERVGLGLRHEEARPRLDVRHVLPQQAVVELPVGAARGVRRRRVGQRVRTTRARTRPSLVDAQSGSDTPST